MLYTRLYGEEGDFSESDPLVNLQLVWPRGSIFSYSLPAQVLEIYEEAYRIQNIAPNAFAVQIRRALEALCEERGARQGPLVQRLQELVNKGELPPVLAEMTDVLRILGNIGAHATSRKVHPSQVHAIDEFFRAVVEYVYIAPSKVQSFRNQLAQLKDTETPNV